IKKWDDIDQVRMVPRGSWYVIEVIYRKESQQSEVDPQLAAALDLGVNVLAALTSTKVGFPPLLVNGRPLKSLNQFYNKQRAQMQSELAKENRQTSHRLDQITMKRNRRVNASLHTASRRIIDLLVEEGIGTLIIGKNPLWKQEVEMGRKQNQQFVQIPHARFIEMLTYKAELVGITVKVQEESYTSKASFLDLDPIPTYDRALAGTHPFCGSRSGRWYRSQSGKRLHSDTNGSYNILRKAVPKAFETGIEGCVVIPRQMKLFT
ncbi:MAG TPA: transposase, partial [Ktedonobacteraceae bacterium]|nr:transposase [Ktedonobacteraceae bacterium]